MYDNWEIHLRKVEDLNRFHGCLSVRFWLIRLSSSAIMKPSTVMTRAIVLDGRAWLLVVLLSAGCYWK